MHFDGDSGMVTGDHFETQIHQPHTGAEV
jgi:hypothetical protein